MWSVLGRSLFSSTVDEVGGCDEEGRVEQSASFFSIIVPNSREGRENRPQLRCGNTPVRSPILPVMAGAQPIILVRESGEGGAEAGAGRTRVQLFQEVWSPNICLGALTRWPLIFCERTSRNLHRKNEAWEQPTGRVQLMNRPELLLPLVRKQFG